MAARATSGPAAGKQLEALPRALEDRPEADRLRRFAQWLDRHAAACVAQVDAWMVSSLPVPTGLLAKAWPEEAWQLALRDLAVVGDDRDKAGFLRGAAGSGELRIVNLDGETVRRSPRTVTLPHPALLPDLDGIRESAAELGIVQRVEQIHRATWLRPDQQDAKATQVRDFSGGSYSSRSALAARATSLGYLLSGAYATARVRDGGRIVEAAVWIGEPSSDARVETGDLGWQDRDRRALPLREVGPVAWSEGMRMAAGLYGGGTSRRARTRERGD